MLHSRLLTCLLLFISHTILAQSVTNVQARVEGNNVIITYNLTAETQGQQFKVDIKSSADGFVANLRDVSGDVGENITPGVAKTVIWNAMKELGKFSGPISFDVIATVTFTPLQFTSPTAGAKVKIGKSTNVAWLGGEGSSDLRMSLMRNNQQLIDIGNVGNSGSYSWLVPKSAEKGGNYTLQLSNPSNPSQSVMSAQFQLKKTSILVYVIPVAVAGGVAAALLLGGDGGSDCNNPCDPNCSNYNPSDPSCSQGDPPTSLDSPPPPPGGGN